MGDGGGGKKLFFTFYLCMSLSGFIHQKLHRNLNKWVIKVLATWQRLKQALIRSQGESICRSCRTRFFPFFGFTHHLTCVWHLVPGWLMSPIFTAWCGLCRDLREICSFLAAKRFLMSTCYKLTSAAPPTLLSPPTTAPHGCVDRISRV